MEPYEISNLTEEALSALERKDYARVIAATDQLIEVVPDDPAVRIMRAEALLKSDAGESAFDEARRAAELAPATVTRTFSVGPQATQGSPAARPGGELQRFHEAVAEVACGIADSLHG